MQRLEVSGVVRLIYRSLGVKRLKFTRHSLFVKPEQDSVVRSSLALLVAQREISIATERASNF